MNAERIYRQCKLCGNLIGMIHDSGVVPECCGQPMELLVPNTVDAAKEKHVPVIIRDGATVTVKVGSTAHPMIPEHFIQWIALAQGSRTQRVALTPADLPEAVFACEPGPVTIYAYCNLHGLWMSKE